MVNMTEGILVSFTWCVGSRSALIQIRCLVGEWVRCRWWWHSKYGDVARRLAGVRLRSNWVVTVVQVLLQE